MLWQTAMRKPPKLKKKFVTALLHGKPIMPKHEPPKVASERFISLANDRDRIFFKDFELFADVVNRWLADPHVEGPWRLQELPDIEIKLDFSDMPRFGRRYSVFHNQIKVGILEVSRGANYTADTPNINAYIQLEWVRLLAFGTVRAFLDSIAMHVCCPDRDASGYLESRILIDAALTGVVWQTQQISEFDLDDYGELELPLAGSATWYFERKRALTTLNPGQ